MLPLGPTAGDSPYQPFSAFAGNVNFAQPRVASARRLGRRGVVERQTFPDDHVDYRRGDAVQSGTASRCLGALQFRAGFTFETRFRPLLREEASWLDGYALFMAIRESLGGASPLIGLRTASARPRTACGGKAEELSGKVGLHKFGQFFLSVSGALKHFAVERKVKIIGDAPISSLRSIHRMWSNLGEVLARA